MKHNKKYSRVTLQSYYSPEWVGANMTIPTVLNILLFRSGNAYF